MRRRGRPVGSWQLGRLKEFVRKEQEECRFYEMVYEKTDQKIPFRILSMMLYFLKDEYTSKPGSLITLYRIDQSGEIPVADFEGRYDKYYTVLQERGYL